MGAQKKKAKFIAKGHLQAKLKQRNAKKKFQALKNKRKGRGGDASAKKSGGREHGAVSTGVSGAAKHEDDMLDDMDVDEFLNADFLESDVEDGTDVDDADADADDADSDSGVEPDPFAGSFERQADGGDDNDGSSSEEEDESALDPRYMSGLPKFDDDDNDNNGDDNDDGDDEDVEDEEDAAANGEAAQEEQAQEEPAPAGEQERPAGRKVLTMAVLAQAERECFEARSGGGLRRMMKMFSDACRSSEAADANRSGEIAYDVQSGAVYNRLMTGVLRRTHACMWSLVGSGGSSASSSASTGETGGDFASAKPVVDERKWKKHAVAVRRFFASTCYLLEQSASPELQRFVLRELGPYVALAAPCPKTARRLLKALLKLWSQAPSAGVCVLAFVRIRDLALQMPFPFLETCLKGVAVTYARNSKFAAEATRARHVLLGNCVVELYGLDMASSYQHAFVYLRQLAISVRKTIVAPSAESFQAVLSWQFLSQLRLWTAVVSAYPGAEQLRPLVYPLCQLLYAVARLANTLKLSPARLHCVQLLQQVAAAADAFVPTTALLLDVLALQPFSSSYKGHKGTTKGKKPSSSGSGGAGVGEVNLDLSVKLSQSALEDKRVHDQVLARVMELLQRECDVYKFHIGFPELALPLLLALAKFADAAAVPKWRSLARGLADSVKRRAEWVRAKRQALDVSPKDADEIDAFLKAEREAAADKLRQQGVADLAAILAAPDADADEAKGEEEEQKKSKKKSKKSAKQTKKARGGIQVDDETVSKVKKMSLHEFQKAVAAVDAADEVGDFTMSDDDE